MDARQEKGLQIAATLKIQPKGEGWIVPSQTLVGKYEVTRSDDAFRCSCPDFELRQKMCKHTFAVEYYLKRETVVAPDGTETVTETRAVRVTYQQDWSLYNAAQTQEKELFLFLLRDLCAAVPEPARGAAGGRPSIPISDALFSACFKVYSGMSSRRFMSDLRDAAAKGFIAKAAHFNSILNVIENPTITPLLHTLIAASAAPLGVVETQFAVDSTGFGTQCFYRHYSAKYGHDEVWRNYLKLHALVGTTTNVIAAATVTDRDSHDYPQFAPLIEEGAKTFKMAEISADKAYLGRSNVTAAATIGANVYIPFKKGLKDDTRNTTASVLWSKLFHLYHYRVDEFLPHYHRRSNAESTFSIIKRVFGETLRSKNTEAQTNELLLMVIAHNIVCVIHSIFELNVTVPGISVDGTNYTLRT
ncbi:MAG: transposase [Acidobacteriota bacterium]|nr:transposase [Acidobacteriota bacterium]